jgi:hypothetical protein
MMNPMTVGAQQCAFFNFLQNFSLRLGIKHIAYVLNFVFFMVKIKRCVVELALAHLTLATQHIN